jgi:hypothetical protein
MIRRSQRSGCRFESFFPHHASPSRARVAQPGADRQGEACPAQLERSESVDGPERSARFASIAVAKHGASQASAKRLRKCAFAQIPPA